MKSEKLNRRLNFAKNVSPRQPVVFIPFRYTFLGSSQFLPRIPRNATISALNACTTLIVRATQKKPAIDSGANPCSCLDDFLRILRNSVSISQGNSHAEMRKLALSWDPTGIFSAKRNLFHFKSMLRL